MLCTTSPLKAQGRRKSLVEMHPAVLGLERQESSSQPVNRASAPRGPDPPCGLAAPTPRPPFRQRGPHRGALSKLAEMRAVFLVFTEEITNLRGP